MTKDITNVIVEPSHNEGEVMLLFTADNNKRLVLCGSFDPKELADILQMAGVNSFKKTNVLLTVKKFYEDRGLENPR